MARATKTELLVTDTYECYKVLDQVYNRMSVCSINASLKAWANCRDIIGIFNWPLSVVI